MKTKEQERKERYKKADKAFARQLTKKPKSELSIPVVQAATQEVIGYLN